ncbi:MAG: peptidoglycan recognition family protein [Planctomycetota bacterium]
MSRTSTLALFAALVLTSLVGCQQKSRYATGGDGGLGGPLLPEEHAHDHPHHHHHDGHAHHHGGESAPLPDADIEPAELRVPYTWHPAVRSRPWKYIVIHHSATPDGGAREFDKLHRGNGWDELGYHFVIGNGTDTPDGAVEVGPRWRKQKHGAHAKTADNRFNELGIGICLVGNFDHSSPTQRQMHALTVLSAHLMQQYRIPPGRLIGHGDTSATACPGEALHARLPALRRAASNLSRQASVAAAR